MLYKAVRPINNHFVRTYNRTFGTNPGILHKVFNTLDRGTHAYGVARFDPSAPLKGFKPIETNDVPHEYNVTNLTNGFTVLTESSSFPGTVNMGFLLDVGTRDETAETSGSLLAIKNTYLKTLKHTNETINYGMIQMSGGAMTMDYDVERTYFRGHCLEYDTIDMFQMMVDLALEPRSVMSANVAKSKNQKSHDLHNHLAQFDPFSQTHELLLRTAYGYQGLGMPRHGLKKNIGNIDARMLQQFVMDNITPRKCLIVASGIKNHKEYVDLVKERLGDLLPVAEHEHTRAAAEYLGGESREWSETPATQITLAFESCPWSSDDVSTYSVMNELLGNTTVRQQNNFVDGTASVNHNFSDSGLFGLTIEGPGSHSMELMQVATDELNSLKSTIDDAALNRAKNVLKMNILQAMERSDDRLEEIARNFMTYGDLTFHQYCDRIDGVSSSDINRVASKVLGGKPTLLVQGGAINLVPSVTEVARQLN